MKKNAKIIDTASVETINDFVKGKNIEKIEPIIRENVYNGKRRGDYIWGYIVYWWDENNEQN
ncbi:MAG: hypothetical protein FWH31_04785 [Streptococcaceae bacterium]|nr:hypothetical protein [Streptococcaceae bacterium]